MTRVDLDHVDRVDPRTPAVTVTEPARRDLALAVALGVGAVMAKVLLSLPRLAEDTPLVVITWVTVVSFVVVGVVLLVSDLPRANAWACLTVAWAAVPGDLNSPAYAESGLSALGFVLEFGYLAAAVALVLRYPHDRLSLTGRRLVGLLVLTTMAVRLPVLWLSGDLPDGLYRPPGWAGARSTFWHDVVLVRGAHGAAAILMLAAAVVLVVRAVRSRGLARQAIFPLAVIGAICSTAAAIDQAVWIDAGLVGRAVPAAMVRDLTGASIPIAVLAHILRRRAAAAMVSVRVLAAAQSGDAAAIERSLRRVLVDESLVLTPHPASGLPRPVPRPAATMAPAATTAPAATAPTTVPSATIAPAVTAWSSWVRTAIPSPPSPSTPGSSRGTGSSMRRPPPSGSVSTTTGWAPRSGDTLRSCRPPGPGSSRRRSTSDDAWNATCMTGPSSSSSPSRRPSRR